MNPKEAEEKLRNLIKEINKEWLVVLTTILDEDRGDYYYEEVFADGVKVIKVDKKEDLPIKILKPL